MGDNWDVTIDFENQDMDRITKINEFVDKLSDEKEQRTKNAGLMKNLIENQLQNFEISENGLANAKFILNKATIWWGKNVKFTGRDQFSDHTKDNFEKIEETWQTELEQSIEKLSKKIAEIHIQLDKNWEDFLRRQINTGEPPASYQIKKGGRTRKRKRRRKRKTRKRKRKKSRKKRKKRRRRTRK